MEGERVKMYIKVIRFDYVDRIHLARDRLL
jgi:hypothetical protein